MLRMVIVGLAVGFGVILLAALGGGGPIPHENEFRR